MAFLSGKSQNIHLPIPACAIIASWCVDTIMIAFSISDFAFIFTAFIARLVLAIWAIEFSVTDFFNRNTHSFAAIELCCEITWFGLDR